MSLLKKAGCIVCSDFGFYRHHSIISDRIGDDGWPMLISLTKRTGTVKEESWTTTTQGRPTNISNVSGPLSPLETLARARSQIGKINYSLLNYNCEHFSRWARGLPVESRQVVGGGVGAGLGYTVAKSLGAKPMATFFIVLATSAIGTAMMKES